MNFKTPTRCRRRSYSGWPRIVRHHSSGKQKDAADWRKVPLRPGALFVVGDPKQSIYRFRRADIDIYNIVRQRFSDPAVGRVVPLTLNFRSAPQLCTWANEVFKKQFPAEPTVYAPRFAPLDASEGNTASGGVFTLTHNSRGGSASGTGRAKDCELYSVGSRCRPSPVQ